MDLIGLVHARLSDDLALAALLADYRGQPAVFSDRVPPDARPPWILIEGSVADAPADTRGLRLRALELSLRCLDKAEAGGGSLDAVAARARALLHGEELAAAGGAVLAQSCAGPLAQAPAAGFLQRRLTLRLLLNEVEED